MMKWLSEWWRGGTAVVEPAVARDVARLAQLHGASFARGWGEGEFESMLSERNTLVHRLRLGRNTDVKFGTHVDGLAVMLGATSGTALVRAVAVDSGAEDLVAAVERGVSSGTRMVCDWPSSLNVRLPSSSISASSLGKRTAAAA